MSEARRPSTCKRLALPAVAAVILAVMVASLARHGGPMLRAATALDLGGLSLALALSLVYRLVNAAGWGLTLGAMGKPVGLIPSARIWLASEACRWLPGSLWSFGSRSMLATKRGIPAQTAAASLVLELGVTVAAWGAVAALGAPHIRLARWSPAPTAVPSPSILLAAIAVAAAFALIVMRSGLAAKLRGRLAALRGLAEIRPDASRLLVAFAFYVAMGVLNGSILQIIVRSTAGGEACPFWGVVAANAVAWLAGFFALFAPGGLVVREACLSGMLCAWVPRSQALTIALSWRLIQVLAEMAVFLGIALTGLPDSFQARPRARCGGRADTPQDRTRRTAIGSPASAPAAG